ncbi:MAG: TonB-dependent receptor [Saprospiraceae bacterium]|nr:TonB-dependent receptor [Saprospiraceae bacterium]
MRKSLFILLFLAIYGPFSAKTQAIFRGKVLDALSREPIVAATVSTADRSGGAYTDTLGHFHFQSKSGGEQVLLNIRCIGYNPWVGKLSRKTPDQIILLEPSENELGAVVISATMKEVSKDASPIPVEVYTPRFFQKNATPTFFEALTIVNGVRPQLNCNVCNTGDIHINGMEGPYTMVTIDGMPIVSGLSTVYGLSGIPNGMVERIEVVKGPASTLYGSEAVGGMVNVITKSALTAPRFFADVFATSNEELNVDLAMAGRLGNAHSLLGINYFNFHNRLDINNDNFTDVTQQDRISVFNKWNFKRKNDQLASLAARYVYEDRWGGEMNWTPQWRGTDSIYGESIYTNRIEFLGKYQIPVPKRRMMLDASWNLHDQNSVYGTTVYLGQQAVAFGQLTTDLPFGSRHDALLGAALRFTKYDDNTPATSSINGLENLPSRVWLPGIFLQDEIELNDKNILLLGLRYDYNSVHGNIFTPRISWKWARDAQHILRFTAGSGYRVANIFTEDHAALTGAREIVIAENLLPERSWNANLNYVRKFFPQRAGFIGLDGSLFFTYFSNQILPDFNTDPNKIIFANLDGYGISTGVSLNLDFNFLNGLKIIAGATAMDVYRIDNGARMQQLFAPPFSGTWTLSYIIPKWELSIDYTGNLNSPMRLPVLPNDPRSEQSPWFSIHNIQLTKPLKNGLELYAGVKNLFGFFPREEVILRAFDPFDKQIDVDNPHGLTFDPNYNYAPMQRQRVLLGMRWTLR